MANLQILKIYEMFKSLVEDYESTVPYAVCKNRDFIRKELKRVLMLTVAKEYKGVVDIQLKIAIHGALCRRAKCFGMVEKWFKRHQNIPKQYVNKLGGYERLSWERSDILQELNIKMLMTIRAWGRRYREYQHTGRYEPIKIEIFIRTAMVNRTKDFFKYVERAPNLREITYASEGGDIDVINISESLGETVVDLIGKRLMICGEDLLIGLNSQKEKAIFMLSFVGFKPNELDKKFSASGFTPSQIVAAHQERLYNNSNLRQLLSERISKVVQ